MTTIHYYLNDVDVICLNVPETDMFHLLQSADLTGETPRVTSGILTLEGKPHTKAFTTPPDSKSSRVATRSPADPLLAVWSADEPRTQLDALRSCHH